MRVEIEFIMDYSQFPKPPCTQMHNRLMELLEWGVKIYTFRKGVGIDCLHMKQWVVDDEVLVTGSCNPTHHGLEANEEILTVITEPDCVGEAASHWYRMREHAVPKTFAEVREAKRLHDEAKAKEAASRRARRSPSSARMPSPSGS